jgi:hypothetical protein
MPARFNYPSLPGNPDSTQSKSALAPLAEVTSVTGTTTFVFDPGKVSAVYVVPLIQEEFPKVIFTEGFGISTQGGASRTGGKDC